MTTDTDKLVEMALTSGALHRVRPEWHQVRRLRAGTTL